MVETKRFYNVTREQFYGVFQNTDCSNGNAEPVAIIERDGCLMQVEPCQVRFVEETEVERKARALDEIGKLDSKDKPEQFIHEVAKIINEIVEGH